MALSQKDADHLNALAEMAAKGSAIRVETSPKTREQEIFEAYQRGHKDAFRIMRNFAGEKLEGDDAGD